MNILKKIIFHLDLLFRSPKAYLFSYTVSDTDIVEIKPFSPTAYKYGQEMTKKIKQACPELKVTFVGSTSLKIAGKGDIDIIASGHKEDFEKYTKQLFNLLGQPEKVRTEFMDYRLMYKNVPLEVTVMDHAAEGYKRQLRVFECLKTNSELRQKYVDLKKFAHGKSEREYNLRQMKLMNEIVGQA